MTFLRLSFVLSSSKYDIKEGIEKSYSYICNEIGLKLNEIYHAKRQSIDFGSSARSVPKLPILSLLFFFISLLRPLSNILNWRFFWIHIGILIKNSKFLHQIIPCILRTPWKGLTKFLRACNYFHHFVSLVYPKVSHLHFLEFVEIHF